MPNYNTETGIPFGTIYANRVPCLYETICDRGDDLTYQRAREDCTERLRHAIADVLDDYIPGDREKLLSHVSEQDVGCFVDDAMEYLEIEEPDYWYEADGCKYLVSWLGGAPLVWVFESPFLCFARPCSPCVPGAGDLDSLVGRDAGMLCYGVDPDDVDPDLENRQCYTTEPYEHGGKTYRLVLPVEEEEEPDENP